MAIDLSRSAVALTGLAEVIGQHARRDGGCACGGRWPCPTLRRAVTMLCRLAMVLDAVTKCLALQAIRAEFDDQVEEIMADEPSARPQDAERVIVDTGRCRVERHEQYGVVITGALTAVEVDGKTLIVPVR